MYIHSCRHAVFSCRRSYCHFDRLDIAFVQVQAEPIVIKNLTKHGSIPQHFKRQVAMVNENSTKRYVLHAFVALSCLFSWTLWGLIIASSKGWLPVSIPLNPWGSFGPAIAAVVVSLKSDGKRGLRGLFAPLILWRWGIKWWILTVGVPIILVGTTVAILKIAGSDISPAPSIPWGEMALLLPVILIVGGPLGEEIGWRGFALPKLLIKHGPIAASLIVAAIWMLWHAPLFWVPGATQEGSSIPVFLALVVAFSILTTWIYLGTNRSLLAAVMFHFSINVATYFLPVVLPGIDTMQWFERLFVIVVWTAALGALIQFRRESNKH